MKKGVKHFLSIVLSVLILFQCSTIAYSSSSKDLTQNGGYRAYLEYYCDGTTTAGIPRKTFVDVYLKKGETLYLGSSVYNSKLNENDVLQTTVTGCDILLIKPDATTVSFDVVKNRAGYIGTVAKETAGPNINGRNRAGFTPLSYTAQNTGIYQLRYHSETGVSQNPTPKLTTEQWAQSTSTIGAWDATVVGTDGTVKSGRTYTKCLALNMGDNKVDGNYMQLNSSVYVVTTDGYIYETNFNGMNPFGFIFFANNRGLVSTTSNYSLYQSYVSNNNQLSDLQTQGATYQNPWSTDTDMDKTFNIFFEKPDPELEGILYPTAFEPETAKNLSFIGTKGNNETQVGYGGYFKFDIANATSATITLDFTNVKLSDGTYKDYGKVFLSNPVVHGTNYFQWDGCNSSGVAIPIGTYDGNSIKIAVETHSGEYHFPLLDVEMAERGIQITRINSIYRETTDADGNIYNENVSKKFEAGKSIIYYNNYARSMLTAYQNPAKKLADGIDATAGVDSTNGAMKFSHSQANYYGDQTALDIWTYSNNGEPISTELTTPVIITDDNYTVLSGRVFYDKKYTDANSTRNLFNVNEGDYSLKDIQVDLTYSYTDAKNNLQVVNQTAYTGADGKYLFFGIPVMPNGAATTCTVTVNRPLQSYTLTTAKTVSNGETIPTALRTTGSEVQTVSLTQSNYLAGFNFSDVGYHYARTGKIITLKKDWVVDISADSDRPVEVAVNIKSYYTDASLGKVLVKNYSVALNNSNSWQTSSSELPEYFDAAQTIPLHYEIASETYTMRNSGATYTYTAGDDPYAFPYYTTFSSAQAIDTTVLTVTNSPQNGSIQIVKRDADTLDLLSGAVFTLYKKTNLTSIPSEGSESYKNINGVIYMVTETATTNQNGIIVFSHLSYDEYYVTETAAKPGYSINSTMYHFVVSSAQANLAQTVYNKRLTSQVTIIKKIDTVLNGEKIPIKVTYSDEQDFTDSKSNEYMVVVSPDTYSYTVTTLTVPSQSYVKVTEGESAYMLVASDSTITDNTDGTIISPQFVNGSSFQTQNGHSYTVTLSNEATATPVSLNMRVHKIDGTTSSELFGAEFSLYSDSNCSVKIASSTTTADTNGEAIAAFPEMSAGTYYLKETKAPSGYLLPTDVKKIVVASTGQVTVDDAPVTVTSNVFTLTVANFLGVTIPQSGATTTVFWYLSIGGGLCLFATILALKLRKREKS